MESMRSERHKKINKWMSTINKLFASADGNGELLRGTSSREQVGLALYFFSTCILINRPCRSRPGLRQNSNIRFLGVGSETIRPSLASALHFYSLPSCRTSLMRNGSIQYRLGGRCYISSCKRQPFLSISPWAPCL